MTFSPCSDLYFVQPVLSGHLAIPRGWPLNTGSTVSSFWSYNFKWWKTKDNLRVDYSGFVWDSRCTPFVSTQPGCFLVRLWYSTLEPGQWDEVEPWPLNLQNCLVWLSCLMTNDYLTTLKNKINKNYAMHWSFLLQCWLLHVEILLENWQKRESTSQKITWKDQTSVNNVTIPV